MTSPIERAREAAARALTGDDPLHIKTSRHMANTAIDAFLASLAAEGMVLVPKTATQEMLDVGYRIISSGHPYQSDLERGTEADVWEEMIAASQGEKG